MKFQVISSGSGGNITYIESDKTRILLDAGITLKEFSKRVDIDLSTIDAIIISHDHGDHTGSLMPFLHKTNAVLYINKDVLEYLVKQKHFDFSGIKVQYIENNKKYLINDITIFTMELSHDADSASDISHFLEEGLLETIHSSEPTLETVFLELTGRKLEEEV